MTNAAGSNSDTHKNPLVKQSIITFVIRAAAAGLSYLLQLVLVHYIGDFEYGIYALAWTCVIMLGHFSCMGFNVTVVRFIPTYLVKNDHDHARGFLFTSHCAVLLFSTLLAGLACLIVFLLQNQIPTHYFSALILAAICIPFFALQDLHEGVARSQSWFYLAFTPTYILRPILIMLIVVIGVEAGADATAISAIIASIITIIIASAIQASKIKSKLKDIIQLGQRKFDNGLWFKSSTPLLIKDGSNMLMTNADILVLSLYVSPEQIGVYFILTRSLALAKFIRFAIAAVSGRGFAEFSAGDEPLKLAQMARQTTKWSFLLTLLATAGILLIGIPLLTLFGERFVDAYPVMFWLALGVVIRGATGAVDELLMVLGHQNPVALILFITLLANLALNFLLIPAMGLYGAAIATSSAIALQFIGLCWVSIRVAGINPLINLGNQPVNQTS